MVRNKIYMHKHFGLLFTESPCRYFEINDNNGAISGRFSNIGFVGAASLNG